MKKQLYGAKIKQPEHSPGPFYHSGIPVNVGQGLKELVLWADDMTCVAQVNASVDEGRANADLLAASPQMLSAIKYALYVFTTPAKERHDFDKRQRAIDTLKRAAAAAEGDASAAWIRGMSKELSGE